MRTRRGIEPPHELLDPEGEGIYLLDDRTEANADPAVLRTAAVILHQDGRLWREVEHEGVYMLPVAEGDEWEQVSSGRWPRYWKLNLPRRWRPVLYAYCTPKPDPAPSPRSGLGRRVAPGGGR